MNLPWSEREELTVEQKLEDAFHRLQIAQDDRNHQERQVGSGKYPLLGFVIASCQLNRQT